MIEIFREAADEFGDPTSVTKKQDTSGMENLLKQLSNKKQFKVQSGSNGQILMVSPGESIAVNVDPSTGELSLMTKAATIVGDDISQFMKDVVASQELIQSITDEIQKSQGSGL